MMKSLFWRFVLCDKRDYLGSSVLMLVRQIMYHFLLFKIREADGRVLMINFRRNTQSVQGPKQCIIMASHGFSCFKLKRDIDLGPTLCLVCNKQNKKSRKQKTNKKNHRCQNITKNFYKISDFSSLCLQHVSQLLHSP